MTECPYCSFDNISGVDVCAQCEQPLSDEYLQVPDTEVERGLLSEHVDTLAPKTPVVVPPDMATRDVLRLMVEKKIGSVFVVEGKKLLGVFSERDALLKLNTEVADLSGKPVSEFMTSKVETLDHNAKIAFAVQRMDLGSFRHVPIVDEEGSPIGVISARDVLRYVSQRAS